MQFPIYRTTDIFKYSNIINFLWNKKIFVKPWNGDTQQRNSINQKRFQKKILTSY